MIIQEGAVKQLQVPTNFRNKALAQPSENAVFNASAPTGALWLSLEMRGFRACGLPSVSSDNEGRRRQRVPIARMLRLGGAKRPLDSAGQGGRAARGGVAEDLRQYCPHGRDVRSMAA